MNRRILYPVLFLLLSAAVSPARGQRFEWATGYSGWDGCEVRGAVTDSRGNVYMIGMFTFGASWVDGEDLYPAGMARTYDGFYTVIAKVSPEGDLVWKRIIATSDGADEPFGIKILGDSSLICLVRIEFPGYLHQQIYYLDTIVEVTDMYDTDIDYPVSPNHEGFGSNRTIGFITLDLDGNLREHHFIDETYLDADGNEYWMSNYRAGSGSAMDFMSFDVDHSGNVYLCQRSCDVCHTWDYDAGCLVEHTAFNGDIKGIRYWHNRDIPIGDIQIKTPTQVWFGRIVKFSPHFDTVLAVKHVFEATDNPDLRSYTKTIRIDKYDNVYIVDNLWPSWLRTGIRQPSVIAIDTSLGINLHISASHDYKGYLIKYDSNLVPQYFLDLQDSVVVNSDFGAITEFHDIAFDYDSNYMFLETSLTTTGPVGSNTQYFNIKCQGVNLDNVGFDQTMLVFSTETGSPIFLKHSKVPSVNYSKLNFDFNPANSRITCANNRVVFQYHAVGGVRPPGGQAPFSDIHRSTLGHIMFDYQGNFIDEECYYTSSHDDMPGPVLMHDSSIYFISTLHSNATYGDIAYPYTGVAIAKYVDTALMHPYEAPRAGIPPMVGDNTLQVWPNPTTGPVNISISRERITEAYLTDASGRREAVGLKEKSAWRPVVGTSGKRGVQNDQPVIGDYTLDLTGHRDGLYILTFVTDSGARHSVKLLKWSWAQPE